MSKKRRAARSTNRKSVELAGRRLPVRTWLIGGGLLLVVLVAGLLYLGYRGPANAGSEIEGLVIFPDPGRGHQDGDLTYDTLTPVGGVHNPTWLHCGIYDEPIRAENVIHTMEHGAVWIAYHPDLPAAQVESLRELVRSEQSRLRERLIVLAPMPGLESPIVATAWRVQLELDDANDERLARFVELYQRGPYHPEPGANCTFGGVGEPIS